MAEVELTNNRCKSFYPISSYLKASADADPKSRFLLG